MIKMKLPTAEEFKAKLDQTPNEEFDEIFKKCLRENGHK